MMRIKKLYINNFFHAMIVLGDSMKLKKIVKIFLTIFLILIIIGLMFLINHKRENQNKINEKKSVINTSNKNNSFSKKCKQLKYCNSEKKERYQKYQSKYSDLSFKDVVTRVNLNLDYDFYTHTKETPLLNQNQILVNKYLYLTEDYIPENLESIPTTYARSGMRLVNVAKDAFVKMAEAAEKDGYKVIAMSSYRSYDYQVNLYNRYVENDGKESADTYSARAGFSEHQTGLCVDIYDGVIDYTNFEKSKSFEWMKNNAHLYGFILRFPKDKENITGYQYESWHYRYVGVDVATYIHEHQITFDEYYVRFIEPTLKN